MWEFLKGLDPKDAFMTLIALGIWELFKLMGTIVNKWEALTANKRRRRQEELHFHKLIGDINKIHELMQTIIDDTSAVRCTIFKTSNGGKLPVLGESLYTSAIYEKKLGYLDSIINTIHSTRLDPSAVKLMQRIITEGYFIQDPSLLPAGFYKDLFESNDIKNTLFFHIISYEHSIYHCVIEFLDEYQDTPELRTKLNSFKTAIMNIFKDELLLKYYSDEAKKRIPY